MRRRRVLEVITGMGPMLAGCSGGDDREDGDSTATAGTGDSAASTPGRSALPDTVDTLAYTYPRPSGNRVVSGRGRVAANDPVDVSLPWTPTWVVGHPLDDGSDRPAGTRWVAVSDEGDVHAVDLADGESRGVEISPERLPAGTPPALADGGTLLAPPDGASRLTHPVVADGRTVLVADDGDLVVRSGGSERRLAIDALPDARIITDGSRAVVASGATTRYRHGALGDDVEAARVTVVDLDEPAVVGHVTMPEPAVFEGIAPIWTDVDGDGRREVVVTEADARRGARLAVYDADGAPLARGPAVGSGYRWRHQIGVAGFGGPPEYVAVKTPHIGGTVEFYRRDGDRLRLVATASGYSSHTLGSRDLDGALIGQFGGSGGGDDGGSGSSGVRAVLVPTDDRRHLGAVVRTDGRNPRASARTAWQVPVGGTVSTNLAGVERGGGSDAGGVVDVAVGREDGTLRVWPGSR